MWKRAILSENSWTAQAFVPSYHRCYGIYVRILRIFYPFIEEITNSQIVSTRIWKAQTVSALWFQITVQSENPKAYWPAASGTWGKTVFLWSMWQRSVNFRLTFWSVTFSKKTTQKFDEFLPWNLKSGWIKKIKALDNMLKRP